MPGGALDQFCLIAVASTTFDVLGGDSRAVFAHGAASMARRAVRNADARTSCTSAAACADSAAASAAPP